MSERDINGKVERNALTYNRCNLIPHTGLSLRGRAIIGIVDYVYLGGSICKLFGIFTIVDITRVTGPI